MTLTVKKEQKMKEITDGQAKRIFMDGAIYDVLTTQTQTEFHLEDGILISRFDTWYLDCNTWDIEDGELMCRDHPIFPCRILTDLFGVVPKLTEIPDAEAA